MNIKLGLFEILTLIFVILKLNGTIDWSWWLVFSPVIITAVFLLIFLLLWIIVLLAGGKSNITFKRSKK